MPIGIDNLDEERLRQAAKLLERENERLIRQVVELKQKLRAAQGNSAQQMDLLAELEQQLAVRNKMLFGRLSEKRAHGDTTAPSERCFVRTSADGDFQTAARSFARRLRSEVRSTVR